MLVRNLAPRLEVVQVLVSKHRYVVIERCEVSGVMQTCVRVVDGAAEERIVLGQEGSTMKP